MIKDEKTYLLPGRTIRRDETEFLYFSGTAYLGLQAYPPFVEKVKEGLDRYGTVYGGSRRSNASIDIFDRCETFLAEWIGSEASVITSSGSLAGKLIADYLSPKKNILYAPDVHPASLHHLVVLPDVNHGEWVDSLQMRLDVMDGSPAHIVLNSVNPLTADLAPVERLAELDYRGEIILYIDDSHGIGLLGREGKGIREECKWPVNFSVVTYGSFAKALGMQAGWIDSDYQRLFAIRNSPLFGGSSPPAPAFMHAFLTSTELVKEQRTKLFNNLQLFSHTERLSYFRRLENYPVFPTQHHELAKFLERQGILISHFAYPTSGDRLFTRIIINSLHRKEDINKLTFHMNRYFGEYEGRSF